MITLSQIASILPANVNKAAWTELSETRGNRVALYRNYAIGNHTANITTEMAKLLRISNSTNGRAEFTANYCETVISMMADRLNVANITADNEQANEWITDLCYWNRFDAMQADVHESAIRDGDTYVMVSYDDNREQARFTHEPAWTPAHGGVLMLYDLYGNPYAALKCWYASVNETADTARVNVYYADKILKYTLDSNGNASLLEEIAWLDRNDQPLGIPIIRFSNHRRVMSDFGQSEIDNVIPLQDTLNRLLHSMVATAELSGFPILYTIGLPEIDKGFTPGMIIAIGTGGVSAEKKAEIGRIEAGNIDTFIKALEFTIAQIYDVSKTPGQTSLDASGEARKQNEIGLLGKVRRAQISFGNSWEDVINMAWQVENTFAVSRPLEYTMLSTKWLSAEIRNDKAQVEAAMLAKDVLGDEETLRVLAKVFDLDESRVQAILDRKLETKRNVASIIGKALPSYTVEET